MAFVTRSGSQLMLNSSPFRFAGCNAFWLGLDYTTVNGVQVPHYPTTFQIDDALNTAKEMGLLVIRALSCGISVGNSLSLWPSLNATNVTAFNSIDYAIYKAGLLGLKLIIPFCQSKFNNILGGNHYFTDWRGITDATKFYTNTQVITDFETYVSVILNRINQYTGIAYKNDPAILAWQLGNELVNPYPPASWSSAISAYIKSIDSNHLICDGAGENTFGLNTAASNLAISSIDMYDDHFYPTNVTRLASDGAAVSGANKVFIAGEYDWIKQETLSALQSWHSAVETNGMAGDCFWNLMSHNDSYGFVTHGDGYEMYYPGQSSAIQAASRQIRNHAYTMQGVSPVPPDSVPTTPSVLHISRGSTASTLSWQGVVGAASYVLERSTTGQQGVYSVIGTFNDMQDPITDTSPPASSWYRLKAANLNGGASGYGYF